MQYVFCVFGSIGDVRPCLGVAKALASDGEKVKMVTHAAHVAWIRVLGEEHIAVQGVDVDVFRKGDSGGEEELETCRKLRGALLSEEKGEVGDVFVVMNPFCLEGALLACCLGWNYAVLESYPQPEFRGRRLSFDEALLDKRFDLARAEFGGVGKVVGGVGRLLGVDVRLWGLGAFDGLGGWDDGGLVCGSWWVEEDVEREVEEEDYILVVGSSSVGKWWTQEILEGIAGWSPYLVVAIGVGEFRDAKNLKVLCGGREGLEDHESLVKGARAVVHHGGSGISTMCLRHRQRQLVLPYHHDQPFWAQLLRKFSGASVLEIHPHPSHHRGHDWNALRLRALGRKIGTILADSTVHIHPNHLYHFPIPNGSFIAAEAITALAHGEMQHIPNIIRTQDFAAFPRPLLSELTDDGGIFSGVESSSSEKPVFSGVESSSAKKAIFSGVESSSAKKSALSGVESSSPKKSALSGVESSSPKKSALSGSSSPKKLPKDMFFSPSDGTLDPFREPVPVDRLPFSLPEVDGVRLARRVIPYQTDREADFLTAERIESPVYRSFLGRKTIRATGALHALDVGGHTGDVARVLAVRHVSHVLSIEPEPRCALSSYLNNFPHATLVTSISQAMHYWDRVPITILVAAATPPTTDESTVPLHIPLHVPSNSSILPAIIRNLFHPSPSLPTPVITIHPSACSILHLLQTYLLSHPSLPFLKLDVEGAELSLLRAIQPLLSKIDKIAVEGHSSPAKQTLDLCPPQLQNTHALAIATLLATTTKKHVRILPAVHCASSDAPISLLPNLTLHATPTSERFTVLIIAS